MAEFGPLLQGIATLLWPLMILFVFIKFGPAMNDLIKSARSRKFTIKVGGTEISMDQVAEQQQSLIADLQRNVLELREEMSNLRLGVDPPTREAIETPLAAVRSVLWVDDNPDNNAYLVAQLQSQGIQVVHAASTGEGVALFRKRSFDRVITDMGRKEDRSYNETAGLDLVHAIRQANPAVPIVVFCSTRAAEQWRSDALNAGATEITSSAVVLLSALKLSAPVYA